MRRADGPFQLRGRIDLPIRGHSSLDQTLDFGTLTEVKQLVPFHHDHDHTDTDLDRLMAQAIERRKPGYLVTPGIEGSVFEL